MKFWYRGLLIFHYMPEQRFVLTRMDDDGEVPNFNHCMFQNEDYQKISEYFEIVHRHLNGEKIELKDIILS